MFYYLAIDHSQDSPYWEGHEFYQTTSPDEAALTVEMDESGVAKVYGTVDGIAISADNICTCSDGDGGLTRLWLDVVQVLEPGKVAYIEGVFSPNERTIPWAWIEILHVSPVTELAMVTFDANCGSLEEVFSVMLRVSRAAVGTLPTPTRDKHKFLGWYTVPEGGTKVTASTKVTGDVTYYAHWEYDGSALVTVVVADGSEGMGTVTGGGKTVKAGTKVSLKATASKGHVFVGWRRVEGNASYQADAMNCIPPVNAVACRGSWTDRRGRVVV